MEKDYKKNQIKHDKDFVTCPKCKQKYFYPYINSVQKCNYCGYEKKAET